MENEIKEILEELKQIRKKLKVVYIISMIFSGLLVFILLKTLFSVFTLLTP